MSRYVGTTPEFQLSIVFPQSSHIQSYRSREKRPHTRFDHKPLRTCRPNDTRSKTYHQCAFQNWHFQPVALPQSNCRVYLLDHTIRHQLLTPPLAIHYACSSHEICSCSRVRNRAAHGLRPSLSHPRVKRLLSRMLRSRCRSLHSRPAQLSSRRIQV